MLQEASAAVGKRIAEMCKEKGIEKVAFDRGGFAYHGRVQVGAAVKDLCSMERAYSRVAAGSGGKSDKRRW